MNVASLDLCKELYELSGWDETHVWYSLGGLEWEKMASYDGYVAEFANDNLNKDTPAYDLGYLLRKLPEGIELTNRNGWMVKYSDFLPSRSQVIHADTPEDATCKLTIELFRQKILKKETK